jgi:Bifunctional DNA primase/polymerase, N-terminal
MTLSAYGKVGAKLIDQGFCALPVKPGTKAPGEYIAGHWHGMFKWTEKFANRKPSAFEISTWEKAPGAGVCVVLGSQSRDLVAIDIDLEEIVEPVMAALPYTPVRKRGKKGITLFYWGKGVKSAKMKRPVEGGPMQGMIDILSNGNQTVLPPTIHKDTKEPYKWVGLSLVDAQDSDIPELPENYFEILEATLRPFGYKDEPEIRRRQEIEAAGDGEGPWDDLNKLALANLDAWVPDLGLYKLTKSGEGYRAVPTWRPSQSGKIHSQRELNLSIHPDGIKDFGIEQGYNAFQLVVASDNAVDPGAAFIWLSDRLTPLGQVITFKPKEVAKEDRVVEDLPAAVDEDNVVAFRKPESESLPPWRGEIDTNSCPGLVGKIAKWLTARALYPQPVLSMGVALATVGTIAGRQLCGPTRSGTHLFILGMAPTGAGKDAPIKGMFKILDKSGMGHLRAGDRFKSDGAIYNRLIETPVCVSAIDEFGSFIARLNSKTASTHEQGISAALRNLWSTSNDPIKTADGASVVGSMIHSPALSIVGTSTAEEFYASLSGQDVSNGFLNRFLIMEVTDRVMPVDPQVDPNIVPEDIIRGAQAIWDRLGPIGSSAYRAHGDVALASEPAMVPWASDEARQEWARLRLEMDDWMEKNKTHAECVVRTAELALRVATIRAIGIDPVDPKITVADMLWGEALAKQSAEKLIMGVRLHMAVNDRQRWANRIGGYLRREPDRKFEVRDIQQRIKSAVDSKYIRTLLDEMVEAGFVELVDNFNPDTNRAKKPAFRWIGG